MKSAIETYNAIPHAALKDDYFDAAVELMDNDIREELHMALPPHTTDDAFLAAYCAKHAERFGSEFVVD